MRLIDRLATVLGRWLSWGFLVIALIMTWEVASRYAFSAPTIWAHEIAGVIAAVAFVFGGAYCMAEDSHMRIDLLSSRARGVWRRVLKLLSLATGTIYLAGMAYGGSILMEKSVLRFGPDGAWLPELSGSSWNTPAPAFVKAALFLGAALFLLVVLRQVFATPDDPQEPPPSHPDAGDRLP